MCSTAGTQQGLGTRNFNPFLQNVTILLDDGVSTKNTTIECIDEFNYYSIASCINYGAQLGASLAMLIVVLVITHEKRRRTPIFILNVLSLVLSFLRSLLASLYFVGPWNEVWAQFASDYTYVPPSAYATTISELVINFILTVTVNTSLVFQTYTVCQNYQKKFRYALIGSATIVLILTVGFHFAWMILSSYNLVRLVYNYNWAWIQTGSLATETASIWFFSLIFTGKLLYILYERKQKGWKQWSAVRVLVLMSGCTMIVPSIFAILEYVSESAFPEAGTLTLTVVALLLPLSSLWAAMTNEVDISLNLSRLSEARSHVSSAAAKPTIVPDLFGESPDRTLITTIESRVDGAATNPSRGDRRPSATRDSTELDLEAMGVRVESSYSVHSSKALTGHYIH